MAVLLVVWLIALGLDAIGCAIVGTYLWRLNVRIGRLLAVVMYGAALEALAILISLFISPARYTGAIAPLVVRLVFRVIKASALIPLMLEVTNQQKRK